MGGGGKWGATHHPQPTPTPKAAPTERPEGPRELQNSSGSKRQEQQMPPLRSPSMGLSKKRGEWGLEVPTPAENPDPREGGYSPSLGPAGNAGGHRGEKLFPPSTFLLLPRSLIPSCPYPYRQWQTVQWPSSHSSAPCPTWGHHREVPGWEMRCTQS